MFRRNFLWYVTGFGLGSLAKIGRTLSIIPPKAGYRYDAAALAGRAWRVDHAFRWESAVHLKRDSDEKVWQRWTKAVRTNLATQLKVGNLTMLKFGISIDVEEIELSDGFKMMGEVQRYLVSMDFILKGEEQCRNSKYEVSRDVWMDLQKGFWWERDRKVHDKLYPMGICRLTVTPNKIVGLVNEHRGLA